MPRDRHWDNLRSRVSKFLKVRYCNTIEDIVSLFEEFYEKFCYSDDSEYIIRYKIKIIEYAITRILGPLKSKSKIDSNKIITITNFIIIKKFRKRNSYNFFIFYIYY